MLLSLAFHPDVLHLMSMYKQTRTTRLKCGLCRVLYMSSVLQIKNREAGLVIISIYQKEKK